MNTRAQPTTSPDANLPSLSIPVDPARGIYGLMLAEASEAMARRRYTAHAELDAPPGVAPRALVPNGHQVIRSSVTQHARRLVAVGPGSMIMISAHTGTTRIQLFAKDEHELDHLWRSLAALLRCQLAEDQDIPLRVWNFEERGAADQQRILRRPWAESRRNYTDGVQAALDTVMGLRQPPRSGRLILWHGAPGTGKTSAVTSLMSEWSEWCDLHLVSDPECLFRQPDYLLTVLNAQADTSLSSSPPSLDEPTRRPWKLIVCEDADEYLRADARQRSGAALGRLLNATDGILGRHSNAMILLTTNDDASRLHPALTRPGRCFAATEFTSLTATEARGWCPSNVTPPTGPATLAELFTLVNDGRPIAEPETIGGYL